MPHLASLDAVKRALCGLSGSRAAAGRHLEGFEACHTAGLDAVKKIILWPEWLHGRRRRKRIVWPEWPFGICRRRFAKLGCGKKSILCGLSGSMAAAGRHLEG